MTSAVRLPMAALIFVSVVPGALRADEAEKQALQAIQKVGGKVTRDAKRAGNPPIGLDVYSSSRVTDDWLKHLAPLKELQWLNLSGTEVTDAGLMELAGFKKLQTLKLAGTEVTDAGLKELASLKELRILDLKKTKVTDAGVAELQKAIPAVKVER